MVQETGSRLFHNIKKNPLLVHNQLENSDFHRVN